MIDYEAERSNNPDYFYRQIDSNLNFHAHVHHAFEYIYCYEGEIEICIDENTFTLKRGQAAMIFPLQVHAYITKHQSKTCLYIFSPSYIGFFYNQYTAKKPTNPIFDFSDFEEINTKLADADLYLKKSYLYLIVSRFMEHASFENFNTKAQDLSLKILEYIRNNFNLNPSLTELCSSLGYSYNYISGFVKQLFHTNFMQLINEYRLELAQSLLLETSKSITQIASECGYDSVQSFNRNFKKIVGFTPSDFRTRTSQHSAT